ncbi:hypothetical protein OSB04_017059 [Centaurea solstitialis]|uniref:BED-type domain-containing protein n=1 Tax=Centaurea solstitialis TaxID=347529 RepID=A0AA38T3U6_9ASTR|nr:hypothetical protein OSB04_017059 [Centaurea solstitialis]
MSSPVVVGNILALALKDRLAWVRAPLGTKKAKGLIDLFCGIQLLTGLRVGSGAGPWVGLRVGSWARGISRCPYGSGYPGISTPNPIMATGSSNPTVESNVEGIYVVQVLEHKQTKEIWDHYDLCEMSNNLKKTRCKYCHKFFARKANSTLKGHTTKSCKALRSQSDLSQANITPQGGVFVYDNKALREEFTKLVIRRALSITYFFSYLI